MMDQMSAVWWERMKHEKAKVLGFSTKAGEDKGSRVEGTLGVAWGMGSSLGIIRVLHRVEEEA
jgi:hypothetical protein